MKHKVFDSNMKPAEKVLSTFTFVMDWIYRALLEFSKFVLLAIIVVVTAQVISRKVFNSSIRWSEEVALFFMVWVAFIAMAIGVEQNLHIAIEAFYKKFPKKMQFVLDKFASALTAVFGIILVYYGIKLIKIGMGNTLPATQWPTGFKYLMIPVGGIYVAYFSLLSLFGLEKYRHIDIEEGIKVEDKSKQEAK